MREINRSLSLHEIRNATHRGFRRIFNKGDDPSSYCWDKGGRLYSIGPDSYQVQKKEFRKLISLDGQPTVEIDIRASFLTIYHALSGVPFDPTSGDPYDFSGIPRSVIKQWLVMALGAEKFPTRWSPEAGKSYRKETGRKSLGHDFPIRRIADAVLQRYPVLTGLEGGRVDYFDLMWIESEAIIAAMLELLREHDIPAFPVHDSLIVPKNSQDVVSAVLSKAYEAKVGIRPALKTD